MMWARANNVSYEALNNEGWVSLKYGALHAFSYTFHGFMLCNSLVNNS